jgi:hypothetical protein
MIAVNYEIIKGRENDIIRTNTRRYKNEFHYCVYEGDKTHANVWILINGGEYFKYAWH